MEKCGHLKCEIRYTSSARTEITTDGLKGAQGTRPCRTSPDAINLSPSNNGTRDGKEPNSINQSITVNTGREILSRTKHVDHAYRVRSLLYTIPRRRLIFQSITLRKTPLYIRVRHSSHLVFEAVVPPFCAITSGTVVRLSSIAEMKLASLYKQQKPRHLRSFLGKFQRVTDIRLHGGVFPTSMADIDTRLSPIDFPHIMKVGHHLVVFV